MKYSIFVLVPGFAQAAIADLEEYKVFDYSQNRDLLSSSLSEKYELQKPEGAFYAFLKKPEERVDLFRELAEKNLLTVPGSVFSRKDTHLRLSFAVEKEVLEKGIEILKEVK
ncbi:MAG: aminotransferase class I/II-fold pyridoxal phosphate-dependent enzyme [Patescibacteria group bacterium]